jgi:DNA-3-methyladenine glycosylase I
MPRRPLLQPMPWTGADDPAYQRYMQREWGVPVRRDRKLFEMLTLQVFQAGLSWATILKRRSAFRKAFADWRLDSVAAFTKRDIARLSRDRSIIRNRPKIEAAVGNARCILALRSECSTFSAYLWGFVGGEPVRPARPYRSWEELPDATPLSARLSRDLKAHGFRFLGPVACYAFMQAVGLVDDRVYA